MLIKYILKNSENKVIKIYGEGTNVETPDCLGVKTDPDNFRM